MHWVAWAFWGSILTIAGGAFLVDRLTGRKYAFNEQERSLNQDQTKADTARHISNRDQQNITF